MTDKNRCMDCQYFRNIRIGVRGSIKGSCIKRTTISWKDWRYGKTPACKRFEKKEGADMIENPFIIKRNPDLVERKVIEEIKEEIRHNNIADFIAVQSAIDIIDKHIEQADKEESEEI